MIGVKVAAKGFALALALNALAVGVAGAETGALELIKEGNHYVASDAKDRIAEIRSEKSVGGLKPGVWFVVYRDARMKTTEVKFDGSKKVTARRPFHLFKRANDRKTLLDLSLLKTDSDKALQIAQKDGLLDKVKLTKSRMTLENWEEMPVWKVCLWAEKARDPGKTAEIGEIFLSAEDGMVVNRDLHLDRIE